MNPPPASEPEPGNAQTAQQWIDEATARFTAAWDNWQSGPPPGMKSFVADLRVEQRSLLLPALALVDIECRARRALPYSWLDYTREFPELAEYELDPASCLRPARASATDEAGIATRVFTGPTIDTAPPDMPPWIGKYRVVAQLPSGGQADLYRAVHPSLHKDVVIKLLRNEMTQDPFHQELLAKEGRLLAALDHPNLARVYDADVHEGRPYLVIDFIPGQTLEQYAASRKLSVERSMAIVATLARAVAAAHQQGVVHQDITPRNVLIDQNGQPRLIDFGLAIVNNAWQQSEPVAGGTALFMSPEQARGETVKLDPRTDVFGLGSILYFLLSGHPPFEAGPRGGALDRARRCDVDVSPLTTAGAPRAARLLCQRALANAPSARYATAEQMAQAIERLLRWRRARMALPLVATTVAVLLLVGAVAVWSRPLPPVNGAMNVKVQRASRVEPVDASVAPLLTGETFNLHIVAPAGVYVTLFEINGLGALGELKRWPPAAQTQDLWFPGTLKQPAGTEVLFVCMRRKSAVTLDEVAALWPARAGWPTLPENALLEIDRERVRNPERDVNPTDPRADALVDIHERLNALRSELIKHCDEMRGLAFVQQSRE